MQSSDLFDELEFDPGRLLDHRYQIVAVLGNGGMGRVYKAFHVMLDAPVALKKMSTPEHATPEERERAIRRFCREARLLTTLRHPNIPRVLDYFTDESSCYLVMDYIEGTTLAGRLEVGGDPGKRAPLPLDEALNYASQLCDVLTYLHSQQPPVVFGDLKPSNVILTPDGRAVMVDFGIARPSASQSDASPWERGLAGRGFADSASDTLPLGTPGYAAPEQYERGWSADPRSDIFALGVLLHEMVTGHIPPPFPFGFQPVRAVNPALPIRLEDVIDRALCFDPAERFQSASQMHQALRLIARGSAFQRSQTQEIVVPREAETHQAIIPAPGSHPRAHWRHARNALLASAGAASVMGAIALGLLIFGVSGGNQDLAQKMLNHPLAAAPTPADTPTPPPTPTPTRYPSTSPSSTPAIRPTSTLVPSPTPDETPTPSPTPGETPTPTPSPTATPAPTDTPVPSPIPTASPTPTRLPASPTFPAATAPPSPTPPLYTPTPSRSAIPMLRMILMPEPALATHSKQKAW
jgi:serine/threonine protein kinase